MSGRAAGSGSGSGRRPGSGGGRRKGHGGHAGRAGERRAADERRVVVGLHPVREVLRAGQPLDRVMVAAGRSGSGVLDEVLALAREAGVEVREVDRAALDAAGQDLVHQGLVAVGPPFPYADLVDVVRRAERRGEPLFCVVADGVTDPHNLGAIARTAEGLGAHGLVIPSRRAAGVTPTVEKAAAGALAHLPLVRVSNIVSVLRSLKEGGAWVVGLEAGDSDNIRDCRLLTEPLVLVVGSEGEGLARLTQVHCDQLVHLPMVGQVASYNASVAAALALAEVHRRREEDVPSA